MTDIGLFLQVRQDLNDHVSGSCGARGGSADLTSRGFDGSISYTADRGYAKLNYIYADVELDKETIGTTSYYLDRPMGHIFALQATCDISDEWHIGGNAEIALENKNTEIALVGYEVFNAYTTYTPQSLDKLDVRLDVRNIFDETYVSRSSDGIDSVRVVPLNEQGRTIALTASIKF